MNEKENEQLKTLNSNINDINNNITLYKARLAMADNKNFIRINKKVQSLVDEKLALMHKPLNSYLLKNQFINWTNNHGSIILGLPYTIQDKADGGSDLSNLETATTVWTKFNLNALKKFSKYTNETIKFGNAKYNDKVVNGSTQDFLKAYVNRIEFKSPAFKLVRFIINSKFNYGYAEFAMKSLADVSSLTNLNSITLKMSNTLAPHKVMSRDKDVSRNFIWSKKSIASFKRDMKAYNPVFARMISAGVIPYNKHTGWREYANVANRDVLNKPYVNTIHYHGFVKD